MLRIILIIVSCLAGLIAIVGATMFYGVLGGSSKVKLENKTYGRMGKKLLIGYASRAGSTAEAADIMGQALAADFIVDVKNIKSVKDISGYDGFILGTAIRAGKVLPEYNSFIKKNAQALKSKPTAIFFLCMTLSEDNEKTRKEVSGYFNEVKKYIEPAAEGNFAGRMDYSKLNPVTRKLVRDMIKVKEGDFVKKEEIKKWAVKFAKEN